MDLPENLVINPFELPSAPLSERKSLPDCSAVYFVAQGVQILYIGQTTNLFRRFSTHHRMSDFLDLDNAQILWVRTNPDLLEKYEADLIKHFNPLLNRSKTKPRPTYSGNQEVKSKLPALMEQNSPQMNDANNNETTKRSRRKFAPDSKVIQFPTWRVG